MRRSVFSCNEKKLISCVRPGVLLVRASLLLSVSVLIALDFPAFERPAKATSEPDSAGHSLMLGALVKKRAVRKLIPVIGRYLLALGCEGEHESI